MGDAPILFKGDGSHSGMNTAEPAADKRQDRTQSPVPRDEGAYAWGCQADT